MITSILFFLGNYTRNLTEEDINKILQRKPAEKAHIISYMVQHIQLCAKYNHQLLQVLIEILQQKRDEIGLTFQDVFQIFHTHEEIDGIRMSCLNVAILNKDSKLALDMLECEKILHGHDTESVLQCLRENSKDDPLKLELVEKIRGESTGKCNNTIEAVKEKLSCCTKKDGQNDTSEKSCFEIMKIVFSVIFQTLLVSLLPYLWDFFSDFQLYMDFKDYNSLNSKEDMELWCNNSVGSMDLTKEYDIASGMTLSILILNGIMYAIGAVLVPTTNVDNLIAKVKSSEYGRKTKRLVIASLYIMKITAKLLWPLFLLMTYQLENQLTTTPTRTIQTKFKTENLWNMVKVLETSFENIIQMAIQLWVLLPIFGCISQKSWTDLFSAGLNGVWSIISFGSYESNSDVETSLGKLLFTVVMLSFGHAMKKLEKPGLGLWKKMKLLVLLFPSVMLQVVARILVIKNLMLMTVPGWYKYTCFLCFHFLCLITVKSVFESRKKEMKENRQNIWTLEWLQNQVKSHKRKIQIIISCLCSSFLQVDIHYTSSKLHLPKYKFLSTCFFYMLIFIENFTLTVLPFIAPTLFPPQDEFNYSSFTSAAIFVNLSWIFVVMIEVKYVCKNLH